MAHPRPWLRVFPPENAQDVPFNEPTGVQGIPEGTTEPIDFFMLLFPMTFFREITRQTNQYARDILRRTRPLPNHSRMKNWVPVTVLEMKKFMAVIINMGLIKKATIAEYWSKTVASQATPWFSTVMSRNRFQCILKSFHVADNRRIPTVQSEHYRPHMKFKPFLDFMNRMFLKYYKPEQNICVDETLIASRGRTCLIQYIPSKSAKFGVKFWVLAESSTGYIIRMVCYLGRTFDPVLQGLQGTNVVVRLMNEAGLFNRGYHVFVDSFFCSLDLAQRLLLRGTYVAGTLRSNRPMPMMVKSANPEAGSSIFVRQGRILVGAYKGIGRRKPVRMLSTGSSLNSVGGIPHPIKIYNQNMGGVDEGDMLMSFYNAGRRSIKVWKKVVFNLTFRMVLNAYVLYVKQLGPNQTAVSRLRFMQSIVTALAVQADTNIHTPRRVPARRRRIVKLTGNKQRDCSVCSNRRVEGRARSRFYCSVCSRGVHHRCWPRHVCLEE